MNSFVSAWSWSSPGTWIVLAILALSVFALAVFLERLWALQRAKVIPRGFTIRIRDLVTREEIPEALTLCKTDDSPVARVMMVGLRAYGRPRGVVKEHLEEIGRFEARELMRWSGAIAVISRVAPLMGLFGTVWGMIDVFAAIEEFGVGNAGALAGGIGTALYTTFAGLMVAIPAH
ncbi:MAG: MotA/TolQ/ExbB proton channel family protein, partial [Myxococcota bacterium]|nr:MotA/TolQ/ExbB proton channel family protein [Myxococcota bacterium]